jgi:hypothetical protein
MADYALTWLADVLLEAGLKVAEVDGWRQRGRGEIGPTLGVMCHHTAGPLAGNMPSLGVVTNGRADLAGPLAQLCLGRDGTYYVVAAGRANHAGLGDWQGISTGNMSFIGIEAENSGALNDPWPDVQMDAYKRGAAAILKKIAASSIMVCGHKEYALPEGRKVDPSFDMIAFRADVEALLTQGVAPVRLIAAVDSEGRTTLRRGSEGASVEIVQNAVGAPVDGKFGPATEAALRQFQSQHGLVPDGIVGPRTWRSIQT